MPDNRKPLIYGAFPVCRNYTVRAQPRFSLYELGYSVVLVARRIGDTVPVVMRTYAHLYPNKQQELVSKLEAIGPPHF